MRKVLILALSLLLVASLYGDRDTDPRSPRVDGTCAPGVIHSHVGTASEVTIAGDGTATVTFSSPVTVDYPLYRSAYDIKFSNWIDVRESGAVGDGITDDRATINAANTAASGKVLYFSPLSGGVAVYRVSSNVTLSEAVWIDKGAQISVDVGVTVSITGTLKAGLYQVFTGAGTVSLSAGACAEVYPEWWGAVGDGATNSTTAFDSAMTAAQSIGCMKIPAGTYIISSPLQNFPTGSFASAKDGYIIEGCGTETVIYYTGTTGYAFEIDSNTSTDVSVPIGVTIRDLHIELGSITSVDVGGGILSVGSFTNIERITTTDADNATGIHARARNTTTTETSMTNDTNRDFTTTGAGVSEKYAIKFTSPTRAATFKSAVVRLAITGVPAGTVHGELWTDSTGSPGAQIAGGDSDTVTISTISNAADGEDITLDFGDSGGRPAITGTTVYWLVIATTGYTYTDGVTELRLRVDAGDGPASGFSTYDAGGVSWSETNDGANYVMNCRYGQPLQVNVNGCGIQSTTAIGRAFWLEDNAFMNITDCYADAVEGVRSEYSYLEWHNLYLITTGVPVYSTGWSKLFGGVIEGPALYPSYFGGKGNTHRLIGINNSAAPVTWESGTWLSQEQCDKDFWWSDYADVVPDPWRYRIIPAQADSIRWDTSGATLAVDTDALNGQATQLNAQNEYIQIIWGTAKIYDFLPRGTYKATLWMKDTNQVANDMIVRSDFYDGSWNTEFENTFTNAADYKPYTLLMRLDASQNEDISYQKRIWLRKATAGANIISVSHVVIEYIGPDIVGDQNVIAVSTDRSNADGGRESQIEFWGSKADDYQAALGQIMGRHDGTGDDYKGEIDFKVNSGGETYDTLTTIGLLDSIGLTITGILAATTVTGANVTTGADPGHTHTGASIALRLDQVDNMAADKTFNNGSNSVSFNFTNPSGGPTYDGAFEIQASGAFVGDLFHVHQHTGNPGVTDLVHFEAEDSDVLQFHLTHAGNHAIKELVRSQLDRSGTSDNDETYQSFYFDQDGTVTSQGELEFGRFSAIALDVSEDTEDFGFTFDALVAGVLTEVLRVGTTVYVNNDLTVVNTMTAGDIKMSAGNIEGETKHLRFNLFGPNAIQAADGEVCIWPVTDAAITITGITVTLDAAGNEILGDLKYADTFIGLASPVVINDFDTTNGVRVDTSISSAAVASGKAIYISFDAAPNAAITQACFDVAYSYD